jgi:DNA-binding NarL/FixJ family response regulator
MVRVFIADDSIAFGILAGAWLDAAPDIEVAGLARSAEAAIEQVVAAAPDVVLLDRMLPQVEQSDEVLAHIRAELPQTAVVLLSGMVPDALANEAEAIGAEGHVSKAVDAAGLVDAVRRAADAPRPD